MLLQQLQGHVEVNFEVVQYLFLEQLTQKVASHDEEMGRLKLAAAADVECKSARIKELEGEMEKTNASALQTWVTGLEPDSGNKPARDDACAFALAACDVTVRAAAPP